METTVEQLQTYLTANSLLAYPAAFVAGLLISFTPCVYPVIPIQLGFIGGQTAASLEGENKSVFSSRGLTLSVLFVVGMSLVYAALGAFAALTGTLFGSWAASPWVYFNGQRRSASGFIDVRRFFPASPAIFKPLES